MSNLSEFLSENDITPAQVAERSHILEKFGAKDRELHTLRANARRSKKSYTEVGADKPAAYGRGVSLRTLEDALAGEPVPRISRKKITRAVNSLLMSQSKSEVEWRALFADVGAKKGKSKSK